MNEWTLFSTCHKHYKQIQAIIHNCVYFTFNRQVVDGVGIIVSIQVHHPFISNLHKYCAIFSLRGYTSLKDKNKLHYTSIRQYFEMSMVII